MSTTVTERSRSAGYSASQLLHPTTAIAITHQTIAIALSNR
ncbi:MAG: hypothetical protein V7K50_17525 [Nostoc sp.]